MDTDNILCNAIMNRDSYIIDKYKDPLPFKIYKTCNCVWVFVLC